MQACNWFIIGRSGNITVFNKRKLCATDILLFYRRYSNTQVLEASCVLIWAPSTVSACKHTCKIRPPFPVENYSNCSRNLLARKYLGEIPTIHSWWKFFSSHTACFNSMTFSNLLKSGPLILLRPYLYLFGNLYRIAFDYALLKVRRNWSGHKSFLISCAQDLPRDHFTHGWLPSSGWFLGSEFLQWQEGPGRSPTEIHQPWTKKMSRWGRVCAQAITLGGLMSLWLFSVHLSELCSQATSSKGASLRLSTPTPPYSLPPQRTLLAPGNHVTCVMKHLTPWLVA